MSWIKPFECEFENVLSIKLNTGYNIMLVYFDQLINKKTLYDLRINISFEKLKLSQLKLFGNIRFDTKNQVLMIIYDKKADSKYIDDLYLYVPTSIAFKSPA